MWPMQFSWFALYLIEISWSIVLPKCVYIISSLTLAQFLVNTIGTL
jgi:hypothetical protein